MWETYYAPTSQVEVLDLLARYGDRCRVLAGGTDLILELERGIRKQQILIDISRIPTLARIEKRPGRLLIGPNVTHNQVVGSSDAVSGAFPLARACWLVGAPQIRNRGTVAGNVVTASPANDTISPLCAMDSELTLVSLDRGERRLQWSEFFLGVRRTALAPDEMVSEITVPTIGPNERGTFLKLGLREAQAISLVNAAVIADFTTTPGESVPVRRARIALGSVAPTIVRASEAEEYLAGRPLTDEVIAHAADLARQASRPISDVRASAEYRRDMVQVLVARALTQLRDGSERAGWPESPVLLWGTHPHEGAGALDDLTRAATPATLESGTIDFTINNRPVTLHGVHGKSLLRAIREDLGLTGTKEGCAEGECGACTVWLDGVAVMSCLVPVERAAGCDVVTVEGLASADGELHPVQRGFIDYGAVQCGYCTPGFLMSAANLLEEVPHPSRAQIREALTGNLCRCTGYYKIIEAIESASSEAR